MDLAQAVQIAATRPPPMLAAMRTGSAVIIAEAHRLNARHSLARRLIREAGGNISPSASVNAKTPHKVGTRPDGKPPEPIDDDEELADDDEEDEETADAKPARPKLPGDKTRPERRGKRKPDVPSLPVKKEKESRVSDYALILAAEAALARADRVIRHAAAERRARVRATRYLHRELVFERMRLPEIERAHAHERLNSPSSKPTPVREARRALTKAGLNADQVDVAIFEANDRGPIDTSMVHQAPWASPPAWQNR